MKPTERLLEHEIVPVESMPEPINARKANRYAKVVEDFLASGYQVARIQFNWPDGIKRGQMLAVLASIKNYVNRNGIPIKVHWRGWDIYAEKIKDVTAHAPGLDCGTNERFEGPFSNELLNRSLYDDSLSLSVRSYNCLMNANIQTVGELVQNTESELLKVKSFGRKSLNEIKEILASMGLSLGMKIEKSTS